MPSYVEEIGVPYGADRSGLVTRTGPSTESAPGERELFDHTNIWIPGPVFQDYQGTATTYGFLTSPEYVSYRLFTSDLPQYVGYSFRRNRMWLDGNLTARIWYGGEFTNTSQKIRAQLAFKLRESGAGGASTAFTEFGWDMDTPSANTDVLIDRNPEVDTTDTGYIAIDGQYDLVTVRFARKADHANDTYTKDLRLIGIEVLYRPRLVESVGLAPWLMKE